MAENTEKKSKKFIILIVAAIIIIIILAVVLVIVLLKDRDANGEDENDLPYLSGGILGYDDAAMILDEESLQEAMDKLKKAAEGQMDLEYKTDMISTDGKNFSCYVVNAVSNEYDMYLNLYKDDSLSEQLLLTGLIPPGQGIDHFESEKWLDPGTYQAVLVFTQVEDDHQTIHAQVMVTVNLNVEDGGQ